MTSPRASATALSRIVPGVTTSLELRNNQIGLRGLRSLLSALSASSSGGQLPQVEPIVLSDHAGLSPDDAAASDEEADDDDEGESDGGDEEEVSTDDGLFRPPSSALVTPTRLESLNLRCCHLRSTAGRVLAG